MIQGIFQVLRRRHCFGSRRFEVVTATAWDSGSGPRTRNEKIIPVTRMPVNRAGSLALTAAASLSVTASPTLNQCMTWAAQESVCAPPFNSVRAPRADLRSARARFQFPPGGHGPIYKNIFSLAISKKIFLEPELREQVI